MVTGDELRSVLRAFPSGICVVTIDLEGQRAGLTVGSLTSLSLEPALVGFALGHQTSLHELLRGAGEFGVSLLSGDHEGVAQHFARSVPPIALWTGIDLRDDVDGPPLLAEARGWLRCAVEAEHPTGDHTFFVGRVVWAELGPPGPGLAYVRHGYRAV